MNNQGLWLNNIKIAISGDPEFKITKNSCSSSLGPKAQCAITVAFLRTSAGAKSATMSATDDATNSPQLAPLSANSSGQGGSGGSTFITPPFHVSAKWTVPTDQGSGSVGTNPSGWTPKPWDRRW
jgi:hypothetical protein